MSIKVIINGAKGKMGQTTVEAITHESDLELVATTGRDDDLADCIKTHQADVVVDFTHPETVFELTKLIIHQGARPVIGTSGLTVEQVDHLQQQCHEQSLGGIIAPNFSLSAMLLMRYAQDAAQYFPDAEIIEMHHPQKVDAPSGTAKKTAELIHAARQKPADNQPHPDAARGEHYQGVSIHAIRLPGFVASEAVIFGGLDETLTLRQDTISRRSFMPGVFLACRKVMTLDHMVYGLDQLL